MTTEEPNKAIMSAVGTLVTTGVLWASTGHLNLDQEGVTLIGGALTTLLVWAISNRKKLLG